jgi:methylated-DNA-[protein]-cysteine S-methyltransferase
MAIARATLPTPFGVALNVACDEREIIASVFAVRKVARRAQPSNPLLREAAAQVDAYFRKRLQRFDLPLHFEGTAFQKAVWTFVSQLETGEIISYGDLARAIGRPLAHRGVAAAMRMTPIDLDVPAHRVVGADGTIRGAGLHSIRRRLLEFEGIILR